MPLKSDHVDCSGLTDTIIDNALELAAHAKAGDVIEVIQPHPLEAYEMVAMSLCIKTPSTLRYIQSLRHAHTFIVITPPH